MIKKKVNHLEYSPHMNKRVVKKKMERRGRFRTQPVTFMEIKVMEIVKLDGIMNLCEYLTTNATILLLAVLNINLMG